MGVNLHWLNLFSAANVMNHVLSRRQEPKPGNAERRSLATRYGIEVLSSS